MRRFLTAALLLPVAVVLVPATRAAADPPAPPGTPTAHRSKIVSTVGPIFRDGLAGDHECTASVLAGPRRDLVLTAAHCITGTAAGYRFVPGYDRGRTPYGVWTVTAVYVPPQWLTRQDPQHDYAVLRVAARHGTELEDVTGGNVLGLAPPSGSSITDVAYNAGRLDRPIRCATTAYGGLHQGGCYEYTSYSSAFRADAYRLVTRATLGRRPDTAPVPGGDGC